MGLSASSVENEIKTSCDLFEDLLIAICSGDVNEFRFLLSAGLPINTNGNNGLGVLHTCINKGQVDIFNIFISINGVDVNKKCSIIGRTPMMMAAEAGNCYFAECLLNRGTIL